LTVGFSSVYGLSMIHQIIIKKRLILRYKQMGKPFDRYSSSEMRHTDRIAANILEWSPVFLGPIWSLALTERLDDTCVTVAWAYVGLRGLYLCLGAMFGVAKSGRNKALWVATFPSYACLSFLLGRSWKILWLWKTIEQKPAAVVCCLEAARNIYICVGAACRSVMLWPHDILRDNVIESGAMAEMLDESRNLFKDGKCARILMVVITNFRVDCWMWIRHPKVNFVDGVVMSRTEMYHLLLFVLYSIFIAIENIDMTYCDPSHVNLRCFLEYFDGSCIS